ncbi:phage protein [Lacticaseibacillus paracasei subsp. paracasei Lpp219]|nr:phage protein [Lacticaseibacillus paracasei subsp. paracasei Lpp219]
MSEEKLYAVKNNYGDSYGKWADSHYNFGPGAWASPDKARREEDAKHHGGHVVTLVEEPKKVVLTKEQAEIIENARDEEYPAAYISNNSHIGASNEEELLMNAYVNGYTVEKDKKYNVKVPYADHNWYLKTHDGKLDTIFVKGLAKGFGGYPDGIELTNDDIEKFGLQDCEKEEVTDDAD